MSRITRSVSTIGALRDYSVVSRTDLERIVGTVVADLVRTKMPTEAREVMQVAAQQLKSVPARALPDAKMAKSRDFMVGLLEAAAQRLAGRGAKIDAQLFTDMWSVAKQSNHSVEMFEAVALVNLAKWLATASGKPAETTALVVKTLRGHLGQHAQPVDPGARAVFEAYVKTAP